MGIREVYDALKAEAQRVSNEKDKEEKLRKYNEHSAKEKGEHDAEWEKQVVLLRELQILGVIPLIEEFTGQKLKLTEEEGKTFYSYDEPWFDWWKEDPEKQDEIDEKVKAGLVWGWEISSPHLLHDTDEWNQDLRIFIGQIDNDGMVPNINGLDSGSVLLTYSPTRELHIMGRETTFKGSLPEDSIARTNLVERKLAEALLNPMSHRAISSALYPDTSGRKD